MTNLRDNSVPDEPHERPLREARELDMHEWREHLAQRLQTDLGVEAAVLLREERSRRDMEIG